VNWATKYQRQRDQFWPAVEHFFAQLPPRLFRQGVLLQNNLATFYADTGQFKDILCRERDHPLLYLHFWLLDDWDQPDSANRNEFEQRLFLAMLFAFAAVYTHESILDESTNFDNSYLLLERALTQQADLHLAHLFPGSSPFWTYHRAFWQEYAEAFLMTTDPSPLLRTGRQPPTANLRRLAEKLAFTKIPTAAVALSMGREDILPEVCARLDGFNRVFQSMREIATLRRDLAQRNFTYPILRTMQEAGLDPRQPLPSEQILGAMVLSGSIAKICQENLTELEECRTATQTLHLPSFAAYLRGIEAWVAEVQELFSVKKGPTAQNLGATPRKRSASHLGLRAPQRPLFAPHVDTLPKVIEMAEGYLLSDLTFRESWEVQRRGVFGLAEMTAKAFPMGLIALALCQHGHDMSEPIDEVFSTLQATGFRYYDHPHLPPDADDLGLLLRLYPYSSQPERHREVLQAPLRWLQNSLGESGEIPVWLKTPPNTVDGVEYPFLSLWGQNCATVEANVLLGLLAYDGEGYRHLIETSAKHWCESWLTKGLSATRHYVPLYALWLALELIAKLGYVTPGVSPAEMKNPPDSGGEESLGSVQLDVGEEGWSNRLDKVVRTVMECLAVEANRPGLTSQDAAFLSLACLSSGNQETLSVFAKRTLRVRLPDWITLLCKTQRYDGSWADEPLFGTPTRGELATWYSSRTVTTAFCYQALKTYEKYKP
jgi:hypothetical protein